MIEDMEVWNKAQLNRLLGILGPGSQAVLITIDPNGNAGLGVTITDGLKVSGYLAAIQHKVSETNLVRMGMA